MTMALFASVEAEAFLKRLKPSQIEIKPGTGDANAFTQGNDLPWNPQTFFGCSSASDTERIRQMFQFVNKQATRAKAQENPPHHGLKSHGLRWVHTSTRI